MPTPYDWDESQLCGPSTQAFMNRLWDTEAEAPTPGTRVRLDDPDFGPQFGRVVVCLCKRHTWQPELPGGAGPGTECGHARCGYPRAASACPWPVCVVWDNGNESHQGPDIIPVTEQEPTGMPNDPPRFAPGDGVVHRGQIFAYSHLGGTAVVVEVLGPYYDGSYEYVVDACEEFSRFPSAANPMTRRTQWASYMTRPAYSESGA